MDVLFKFFDLFQIFLLAPDQNTHMRFQRFDFRFDFQTTLFDNVELRLQGIEMM